jgi:hypothetical protein
VPCKDALQLGANLLGIGAGDLLSRRRAEHVALPVVGAVETDL